VLHDASLWSFIIHANIVVKIVLLLLLLASITSWTIIFQRWALLRQRRDSARRFEGQFFSNMSHNKLYEKLSHKQKSLYGLGKIFFEGFKTFMASSNADDKPKMMRTRVSRAMRIAHTHEVESLEKNMSMLATIGSNAVYVGLLGTVWGVMSAFEGLGLTTQATISSVAPGIAEALIATAMGLIAAIPAVVAYNLFNNQIEQIDTMYHVFQDEFMDALHTTDVSE
jgi:biopolymer transport protein TolQ